MPRAQSLSYSGPSPEPLCFPSLTSLTRAQAMVQAKQPLFLIRIVSAMVSPLTLSAPSNWPCWKFRVGRNPWALITFTRIGVPYFGRPPPVAGDSFSFLTTDRQADMNSLGRATLTDWDPLTTTALRFLEPITAP